jgi:hypothetical protein
MALPIIYPYIIYSPHLHFPTFPNPARRTTIFCSGQPRLKTVQACLYLVTRNYTTINLRLPQTSLPDLKVLNAHVERRRPKPKIQQRHPKYYQNLINKFNKTTVKRNYADPTKDNL